MHKKILLSDDSKREILDFLEECEWFNGKNMSDCSVYVHFQGSGLGASSVSFAVDGSFLGYAILPYKTFFRIERNGKVFNVRLIDNRNYGKFL